MAQMQSTLRREKEHEAGQGRRDARSARVICYRKVMKRLLRENPHHNLVGFHSI